MNDPKAAASRGGHEAEAAGSPDTANVKEETSPSVESSGRRRSGRSLPIRIRRRKETTPTQDDDDDDDDDDRFYDASEKLDSTTGNSAVEAEQDQDDDDDDDGQLPLEVHDQSDDVEVDDEEISQEFSESKSQQTDDEDDDDGQQHMSRSAQGLEAILPNNGNGGTRVVSVSIVLDDGLFEVVGTDGDDGTTVGHDGNLFYCHVCDGAGEIVCCDGCPRVFHPTCIPRGSSSRRSLDANDDPWFCPVCLESQITKKKDGGTSSSSPNNNTTTTRRATKRMCCECRQSGGDNPLMPCESCGVFLHHPSCRNTEEHSEMDVDHDSSVGPVLCSNCTAGEVLLREEDELEQKHMEEDDSTQGDEDAASQDGTRRKRRRASVDTASLRDEMMEENNDGGGKRRAKRKHSVGDDNERPSKKKKDSTKKRKKKKKRSKSLGNGEQLNLSPIVEDERTSFPASYAASPRGTVKATPGFFFFINENRFKIERALSRKHRYFNRLPKGMERNKLIAREAAIWWVKLRPTDHRRYLNMSMRDFEERVVEWKEEKALREMLGADSQDDGDVAEFDLDDGEQASALTPEDERITYETHQKLFLGTSVGSKPLVPEPGKSNNRLLLELLQDMRFHPVPLLSAARSGEEPGQADYSKMSIPFFEVHGPVATSVGDECQGCTRGWNHFCPVLKRRLPAVENRAKLQPPLSALMATRVGLGLRPRLPTTTTEDATSAHEAWRHAEPFSVRPTTEAKEAKQLPPILSYTMSKPSARADDIVDFVEEATAMKITEPPRPLPPQGSTSRTMLSRGVLPIHGRKKQSRGPDNGPVMNKCGRCRAVVQNDTGCVQCRRAQLVINMSKQHAKDGSGMLKVQTAMLGRLSAKDSNFDKQSEEDRAVSNAMVQTRWSPNAVLPPHKTLAPEHVPGLSVVETSSAGDSSDEEASTDASEQISSAAGSIGSGEGGALDASKEDQLSKDSDIQMSTSNESERAEEAMEGRTSRRQRPSRRVAPSSGLEEAGADRQQIAQEHQEEAVQLQRRCISVASCGILLAMLRRDPLLLFAEPVPADVEAYTKIVTNPIDFGKIKAKVLGEEYKTLGAFISDARRLCTNALAYNPAGTIYSKTAQELLDVLEVMQKRANKWMQAIKNAHASSFAWRGAASSTGRLDFDREGKYDNAEDDPFRDLRKSWPEAVDMLESGDFLKLQVAADFMRTRENETAFYGSLAIRRAAAAAEVSLASYPDTGGVHNTVVRRSHIEDEALRSTIDKHVAEVSKPVQLKDMPTWREESILKLLRRVQTRRVEGYISSENGCARCDGDRINQDAKVAMRAEAIRWGKNKRKGEADTMPRVASSRMSFSTGLGSSKNRELMKERQTEPNDPEDLADCIGEVGVSVRGSRIHGWGLFADQPFKAGDVVSEYVGEYVTHAMADAREKMYQEQRIQDYQFRADELVIDATKKGGHGRYINHNCSPNCIAKIVEGKAPNRHLKRVIIIAQRNIEAREEITYDYQFPLELDLDSRIPCNCGSESCRGFMNWDLPEKGSKNRTQRGTKRGGNMRDRIRRLNRPRKRG